MIKIECTFELTDKILSTSGIEKCLLKWEGSKEYFNILKWRGS